MVVLKCKFGTDTRRIRIESLTFEQLIGKILPRMFNEDMAKYHVTYTDPENDTVFITNEIELKEALVLCPEMLVISLRSKTPEKSLENTTGPYLHGNNGDVSPKRKANGSPKEEKRSPSPPKKQKTNAAMAAAMRASYNYTPVRVMVIESLKYLTSGGTIHDIMDYVNENFPIEAKNIKDLHKAIQGRLSSRKEFVKANFKKLDKLTKKECTVWTLSTQAGTKKVQRPHKGKRSEPRVKYDEGPSWEDEDEEEEEEEEEDEEDEIEESDEEDEVVLSTSPADINYHDLVVEALRAIGGKGTIHQIREWLMINFPDNWAANYKLHRTLSSSERFEEVADTSTSMKVFRLATEEPKQQPDPADLNEHSKDLLLLSGLTTSETIPPLAS